MSEPLLFELGRPDRPSPRLPEPGVKTRPIDELVPAALRRQSPVPIASLSEPEVARHFGRLGRLKLVEKTFDCIMVLLENCDRMLLR